MSYPRVALPIMLLTAGCIPELHSNGKLDDVFEADGSDYEVPENSWEQCDPPPQGLQSQGFAEGEVFPDLRMMDQHGDETSIWQWYGCVIAVDVSPMWCAPCRQLAKEVDHTWEDYRDQGFMYVTMLPQNSTGNVPSKADLNAWATEGDITAPVLQDLEGYSYDLAIDGAFPRIVIIGRDMTIDNGNVTPEDVAIRAAIQAAL